MQGMRPRLVEAALPVPVKRRLQRIAASFNSKARKYHARGVVSWEMLANVGRLDHSNVISQCAYCGTELRLEDGTWDHVVPFDKGGQNTIDNIWRCCTFCQRRKFTKSPAEYAQHQALVVVCALPGCTKSFKPRWAEYQRGMARYCSHAHAGAASWL